MCRRLVEVRAWRLAPLCAAVAYALVPLGCGDERPGSDPSRESSIAAATASTTVEHVDLAAYLSVVAPSEDDGVQAGDQKIRQPPGTSLRLRLAVPRDATLRGSVTPGSPHASIRLTPLGADRPGAPQPKVVEVQPDRDGTISASLVPPLAGTLVTMELVAPAAVGTPLVWTDLRIERPAAATPEAPASERRPNVLVVVFDSLRADHISALGAIDVATPETDTLAANGATFRAARAPASWTRPAITSLLTSLPPAAHGVSLLTEGLAPSLPYLPEVFAEHGYHTVALTHSPQISPSLGFDRGFARFHSLFEQAFQAEYKARETARERAALVWDEHVAPELEAAGDTPLFIYLHEMDPHYPYTPPAALRERYATDYEGRLTPEADVAELAQSIPDWFGEADARYLNALYRGEIDFMDRYLGEIRARLEAAGLTDSTVVVFTSDHGDEFLDHDGLGHAGTVYEELLRVPLVISWPGVVPAGRSIESPVTLTDVAPTLLALAGIETPPGMAGRSLVPRIFGAEDDQAKRPFVAEAYARDAVAIRYGRWKLTRIAPPSSDSDDLASLIARSDGDVRGEDYRDALYDLERDPLEQQDRSAEAPQVARALGDVLLWRLRERGGPHGAAPARVGPRELTPDGRERLKALGYLEE
jgi:arylsulfatase A-like enzyme